MNQLEQDVLKVLKHISHVQEAAQTMAFALIKDGKITEALLLLNQAMAHDAEKFKFDIFFDITQVVDKPRLKAAVLKHAQSCKHHPEYWKSIYDMDEVSLMEMVCDWKARSSEFGTSLEDWTLKVAPIKYNYTLDSPIHRKIMYYMNLILDKKFETL